MRGKNTILAIVLFVATFGMSSYATQAFAADLTVVINGVGDKGNVLVALFKKDDQWLRTPSMGAMAAAKKEGVSVSFKDLAVGEYAVSLFVDENSNGIQDTNSIGIPIEPYGFSNDPTGNFPPSFEQAKFVFGKENKTITINIKQDYSDMWWAGSAENGWGISIQQHESGVQFNAIYVYDSAGKPVWYVMPGGTWSNNFTTYTGPIYQPTGAPLSNYNAANLAAGISPGNVSISFTSSSTAVLSYTINGVSGTKNIVRQSFAAGTSTLKVNDLWWVGPQENGWGINIAQQGGALFCVWYTYGQDGKATWFVMPGGTWNGNTYSGPFYSTVGSPWLGAMYNPNMLSVSIVGTMSFNFSSANSAVMRYSFTAGPFAGTTQTKTIVRQAF
jgi:uncharacterized protein (DUF2141 family)